MTQPRSTGDAVSRMMKLSERRSLWARGGLFKDVSLEASMCIISCRRYTIDHSPFLRSLFRMHVPSNTNQICACGQVLMPTFRFLFFQIATSLCWPWRRVYTTCHVRQADRKSIHLVAHATVFVTLLVRIQSGVRTLGGYSGIWVCAVCFRVYFRARAE